MIAYLIRRLLLGLLTVVGVCLFTFSLFYLIVPPDRLARQNLHAKNPSPQQIHAWEAQHGYDKPRAQQFVTFTTQLLTFQFPDSDVNGESVGQKIRTGMGPSLMLAIPEFFVSLLVTIPLALLLAYYRGTYLDTAGTMVCVFMMSMSILLYIIVGQFIIGKMLRLAPIVGFAPGLQGFRFIVMPLIIGVVSGMGGTIRFFRTAVLEEMTQDYVRTSRAIGVSEAGVLFRHVLKNSMIPILTSVVMSIPFLFLGSLLMESFFGIPGLGSITMDAISSSDFAVLRVMVYIGSLLYILGTILTDISYTLVDPRVRFGS